MAKCTICGKERSWLETYTWVHCPKCHVVYCNDCKKGLRVSAAGGKGPAAFECIKCGGAVVSDW